MFTLKMDHRISDSWTLSGFYLYNKTDEPGSGIMPADFQYIENQAEFFTTLRRRPHVLAINNTNILNDTTVLTLRYGWQTWQDQTDTATYYARASPRSASAPRMSTRSTRRVARCSPSCSSTTSTTWAGGAAIARAGPVRTRSTAR